jgi:hypothetical protein
LFLECDTQELTQTLVNYSNCGPYTTDDHNLKLLKLWPVHHWRSQSQTTQTVARTPLSITISNYSNCGPYTTDDHNRNSTTQTVARTSLTITNANYYSGRRISINHAMFYTSLISLSYEVGRASRCSTTPKFVMYVFYWSGGPPSFFNRKGSVAKKKSMGNLYVYY